MVVSLGYGGKREVTEAFRKLLREVEEERLDPEEIDEKTIESHLRFCQKPDLVIRAGGKQIERLHDLAGGIFRALFHRCQLAGSAKDRLSAGHQGLAAQGATLRTLDPFLKSFGSGCPWKEECSGTEGVSFRRGRYPRSRSSSSRPLLGSSRVGHDHPGIAGAKSRYVPGLLRSAGEMDVSLGCGLEADLQQSIGLLLA